MNVELGQKVLDRITEHPEDHDQATFYNYCSTTLCIGGHALVLSGEFGLVENELGTIELDRLDGQDYVTYATEAQRILDIDDYEAERLFFTEQDPDEARDYLASLIQQYR